jgi:Xaa-Pro aminopeptidase
MALLVRAPDAALAAALRAYRDRALPTADGGLSAGKTATRARLASLRARMTAHGLDAFVVPRADAHQGEFVPPHAQRLRWLTGFSGSAGTAVVTADRAALFVDGRYTLQARGEVDTDLFEVVNSGDTAPSTWIGQTVAAGARVGHDPWLHTPDGVARLRTAAGRAGATLTPAEANPVDDVWTDQPAAPLSPVVPHDLGHAGETSAAKRHRVAAKLTEAGAAAAVLSLPASIAWLLNVRGSDIAHTPVPLGFALVHDDGTVDWYVDPRKLTDAVRGELDAGVRCQPPADFGAGLDALGAAGATVLLDPATAPVWTLDRVQAAGAGVHRAAEPVEQLKAAKNDTELDGARAAHLRDGAALVGFLAWLDREAGRRAAEGVPVTEIEAASVLAGHRQAQARYMDSAFETIAGAGEHGAIVHYRVTPETDRPLQAGELFLCDSGGQYLDGTTDVTRTIAVGPPSEAMRAAYTRVLQGHIALATTVFPAQTTGSQLDALARRPLWSVGLDYAHGTGHGVGSYLGVHEGPQRISKQPSQVALVPGMICSNEPGHYREGAFGIRIENLIVVRAPDDGMAPEGMHWFETLTLAPYCRALIDPSLLSAAEIAWIDAYHARVHEALRPRLDGETADWLDAATAPLAHD